MVYFNDLYDSWEKIQQNKYEQMMDFVQKMDVSGKCVLDVGCGNGLFEQFLHSKGIDVSGFVGIEPDKKMFDKCPLKNKIQCSAENMNFRRGEFDCIVCIDAIHLVRKCTKMKQVLKLNGFLLVGLFCNDTDMTQKEKTILKLFEDFVLIGRKVISGKEKELVFLFQRLK